MTAANVHFEYNGEPIADIEAWAAARGEQMVRMLHRWHEHLPVSGRVLVREEEIEVPTSFAGCMRFGGPNSDRYLELDRRNPEPADAA